MSITRIKNNQITDLTVNAAAKLQDFSITSGKIANNLTYNSSLTVAGNFTVQGNTTTIDTVNLVVEDPLILLAKEQSGSPTLDIGFIGKRGTEDNIAFVWDESAGEFITAFTTSEVTNTVISINAYASLRVANLTAAAANVGNLDIGNISFTGNVIGNLNVTGNVSASNFLTTGIVSASGNVTGGNVTTAGLVTATGNVTGGNVTTAGEVTATGNITGGNLVTAGLITATGNVTGGNLITAGLITATGNITGGNVTTAGNVQGGNLLTGGLISATGNITGGNVDTAGLVTATGNVTGGNLTTAGVVTATGNVTGGNVTTAGEVTATGNVTGGNVTTAGVVTATGNVTGGNLVTAGLVTATGNVTGGNVTTAGEVTATGNVTGGNLVTAGLVTATGNVTGGNITTAGNVQGGNILTGGLISATGNITGGNLISGNAVIGNIDVSGNIIVNSLTSNTFVSATGNVIGGNVNTAGLVTATGNVTGGNVNTAGVVTATGNVTGGNVTTAGLVTATGNVTGGNLVTAGVVTATGNVTGGNVSTAGVVTASGNVTGGNLLTSGLISATGNITGGNVITSSVTTASGDLVLNSAGGALQWDGTGNIVMNSQWINNLSDPIQAQDAATKEYVDNAVSSGITIHTPVRVETPTALNATYAQGGTTATVTDTVANNTVVFSSAINPQANDQYWFTNSFQGIDANTPYFVVSAPNTSAAVLSRTYSGSPVTDITSATGLTQAVRVNSGQGATLTNAGANAALSIDGISLSNTNRVLVYNQANAAHNGVYVVSNAGDGSTAWELTRSDDTDTYSPNDINGLDAGDYFFVQEGDTGAGESYVLTAPIGPVIIGYNNLTFTQFSSSTTYTANTAAGLFLNGTVFNAKVDNNTTAFDGGGNIIVKAGANLVTPNIGAATGTSLSVTGNVTGGNINTAGVVTATGNVTGGNVTTAGLVTATGNITGGNLTTAGLVTATGNVTGGNLTTAGEVTATGNVTGGNVSTAGAVSATGNITGGNLAVGTGNITGGNISVTGNITAVNFIGNISGNIDAAGANTQVQFNADNLLGASAAFTFDTASNVLTVGGTIQGTTVSATGNVIGGNVSTAGLVTATGNVTGGNVTTAGLVTATGNVTGGNLTTAGEVTATGNVTGGNVGTAGVVTATGNVTGGNLLTSGQITSTGAGNAATDGGQIFLNGATLNRIDWNTNGTGAPEYTTRSAGAKVVFYPSISASATDYALGVEAGALWSGVPGNDGGQFFKWYGGNVPVASLSGTGVFSATGNITSGNLTTAGEVTATGNVTGGNLITAGLVTATGNVTGGNLITAGLITATGNVTGGNLTTVGLVTATGNITGGNLTTTGEVTATGNVTGGNLTTVGTASLGNIRIAGDDITGTNGIVTFNDAGADIDFRFEGDTDPNLLVLDAGTDTVNIGTATPVVGAKFQIASTDSMLMPVGNIGQRPGTPVIGMVRYTTTSNALEVYTSTGWEGVGSPDFTVITADEFTGDGSTVIFTLTENSTTAATIVSINGVVQQPVTAYAVSGNVLTFTEAPESTDVIDARIVTTTTTVTQINNVSANAVIEVSDTANSVLITGSFIPTGNATANIGNATNYFNRVFAVSTSAIYSDLAEMYLADAEYLPGTVVSFGGPNEITLSTIDADPCVAGVISTAPSYLMNSNLEGEHVAVLALTGRVPTRVTGTVRKGDMIVSAGAGLARAEANPRVGTVIGKSLEDFTATLENPETVIEVVIGKT